MATNTVPTKQDYPAINNISGNTSGPYAISFDYLSESDVEVRVDNVLKTQTTHYTFPSKASIQFTSGNFPALGATIEIKRNTNITTPKVDFQDGSVLTESDLDNNSKHILFGMQETKEDTESLVSTFVGANAPTGISNGARWYDTVSGRTFIYYVDTDRAQWVEANPPFDATKIATESSAINFKQASSTTTRTVESKLQDFVSVKDFGAKGDGTTDDTSAFQNAINTGKPVYVPKATYKITDTLTLNAGYRCLIGDEAMPVIEMHTDNKPAIAITEPSSGLNEYSRVENLYIQRKVGGSFTCPNYNATLTETLAGVVVSSHGSSTAAAVQSTRISNLRVGNFAIGFYFADCVGVTVHKCFTQNLGTYTSATQTANGTTITSSMFGVGFYFDATRFGFDATTDVSEDLIICNSHGFAQGTAVIFSGLSNTTGISNNVIYYVSETSNTTNSFRLTTATDGAASGNITLGGSDDTSGVYVEQKGISPLASIEIVECDDNREGSPSAVKTVSYLALGRDIRDIFFQRAESTKAKYGWYIDGQTNNDLNWDVHIIRPIIDQFAVNGIFATNIDGVGALSITGGYFVGASDASACIYATNSNGVAVTGGAQLLGLANNSNNNTDDGVRFDNCSSCLVVGNRFANLQYGVSLNGTSYTTVQGNVISAATTEDEGTPTLHEAIRLFGTSTRNTIMGNTIRGKGTSEDDQYSHGIKIVTSADDKNVIIGNVIDPDTVASEITDASSNSEKANNMIT